MTAKSTGSIALLGGGEWTEPCRALDSRLLHLAESDEVLIVPTAAAFEHPERAVEQAAAWFRGLGGNGRGSPGFQSPRRRSRRERRGDARRRASSTSPTVRRCICARC